MNSRFRKGIFRSRAGNFSCWPRSSRYSTVDCQGISGVGQFVSGSRDRIPGVECQPRNFRSRAVHFRFRPRNSRCRVSTQEFQISAQVISGVNCRPRNFRSRAGDFRCWSFVMRRVLSASNFRFRADNSGYLSRSWEIYFGSWSGSFRRRSMNFWSRAGNLRCPGRTSGINSGPRSCRVRAGSFRCWSFISRCPQGISGIGQGVQVLLKEIQVLNAFQVSIRSSQVLAKQFQVSGRQFQAPQESGKFRTRADYSRCRARKYRYRASKIPGIGQGIFS